MALFTNISNGQYVNQYDSEVRITAAVASTGTSDKQVSLFSTVFPVPSGQFSVSLDPILGKTRTINDIFNKRGFFAGSTSGEVQLTEKTTSITLKTDYVFLAADKKGIEMSGNILEALIKGEGFIHDGEYKKVVGTNGTYKKGFNTVTKNFFGKLVELDGRLVIADAATDEGNAITVANSRKTAYDKTCNYLVFEIISKFDEETVDGLRFVYTMNGDISWSDATDANELTFTQTQLCDARLIKKFLVEGWDEDLENGADIPARRIQFAKHPVSCFKAIATGVGAATTTLEAATNFTKPTKVITSNLTLQIFEETTYDVGIGDIGVFYIPGGDATNTCITAGTGTGAYALGVYTETGLSFATASSVDTYVVLTTAPSVVAGDLVQIGNGSETNNVVVESVTNNSGSHTIVFDRPIGFDVDFGAGEFTIAEQAGTTTIGFKLVKSDYDIGEKTIYDEKLYMTIWFLHRLMFGLITYLRH